MIFRRNYPEKKDIVDMVKNKEVTLAGNNGGSSAKIYGKINDSENGKFVVNCRGGRDLLKTVANDLSKSNQVFFKDEIDALEHGFRPCFYCFPELHKSWKAASDKQAWIEQRLSELRKK